ncbi:MAG: hypothetical protein CM15mP112_07140 [Flavobacteriales bacterium]|nr:MAG: hypothetical protein CM15mP112_07140 [Flavobacteriales bacterium]
MKGKLLKYSIQNLETGNYNLVCEIRDYNNRLICTKKVFQRSNNLNNENRSRFIINDINFSRDITNIDTLKKYIDYLYPISNTNEDFNAKNQFKYNNLELMQNYFLSFGSLGIQIIHF